MDDHRLAHLLQNATIDLGVVVRRLGGGDQRAARHQDDAAAGRLHRFDLFLIGADHVVDRRRRRWRQLVGADARIDHRTGDIARGRDGTLDEFERVGPIQPHAALRGVHCFGDAETERPEVAAERNRRVPVDRRGHPGVVVGKRIGDDMRRGKRDARRRVAVGRAPVARPTEPVRLQGATRYRQIDYRHRAPPRSLLK
jgi:hypothetical protein